MVHVQKKPPGHVVITVPGRNKLGTHHKCQKNPTHLASTSFVFWETLPQFSSTLKTESWTTLLSLLPFGIYKFFLPLLWCCYCCCYLQFSLLQILSFWRTGSVPYSCWLPATRGVFRKYLSTWMEESICSADEEQWPERMNQGRQK